MIKTSDKVFVVSLDKIEELDIQTSTLETMSIEELEKISCGVLEPKQAIKHLNFPEISPYDVEDHLFIYREIEEDQLNLAMGVDDYHDVIINKELHIHIKSDEEGYAMDLYPYRDDQSLDDEDRDLDDDLISGTWVTHSEIQDLLNEEE